MQPSTGRDRRHLPFRLLLALALTITSSSAFGQERPTIGVAFGGGSARGIAHVGVIRWFEEHRIPIDVAAGTSMGGLIGGSFATGMDAAAIQAMLQGIDWDQMFGFSNYAFKNIRRKADAQAYPSRLEFGVKSGIVLPPSLNSGHQVDLLITRITAAYYAEPTFATLPTPFKVVAVDLRTAEAVVLDRGSLARAMRATMSLPAVFPPVEIDGQVLVDGGAMNNVPADVVRAMGARTVIAINVGDLNDKEDINYSILGLAGATIDAMMRANTKKALTSADIVLTLPLVDFGSLDWRRSDALIEEGYKAAEAMRDVLLPHAVSEEEWRVWQARRTAARKSMLPQPTFVTLDGVGTGDERRINELLRSTSAEPIDVPVLERDLEELSGLDRYESITWRFTTNDTGAVGLAVSAIEKRYAPPFLMLGLNLENTTSDQFQLSLTGRYLRFDVLGSGSELRLDAIVGADPGLAAALYQPIWRALFVSPHAGVSNRTFNFIDEEAIVARYSRTVANVGAQIGVNLGRDSDLRLGATIGRLDASVKIGDPGLPAVTGKETLGHLIWRLDTQDSAIVPSRGTRAEASFSYVFDGPNITVDDADFTDNAQQRRVVAAVRRGQLVLAEGRAPPPVRARRRRHVLRQTTTRGGSVSDGKAVSPGRLQPGRGARRSLRHRHGRYPAGTGPDAGFYRRPDLRRSLVENGDAFDDWDDVTFRSQVSGGLILETLVGPMILAGSAGFDGRWRTYVGIGRLFR